MAVIFSKYIWIPLVAVIGIYIVGSVINELFGIPATALFVAVGGVAFIAKFYKDR
jgi:hypothetical protein